MFVSSLRFAVPHPNFILSNLSCRFCDIPVAGACLIDATLLQFFAAIARQGTQPTRQAQQGRRGQSIEERNR